MDIETWLSKCEVVLRHSEPPEQAHLWLITKILSTSEQRLVVNVFLCGEGTGRPTKKLFVLVDCYLSKILKIFCGDKRRPNLSLFFFFFQNFWVLVFQLGFKNPFKISHTMPLLSGTERILNLGDSSIVLQISPAVKCPWKSFTRVYCRLHVYLNLGK